MAAFAVACAVVRVVFGDAADAGNPTYPEATIPAWKLDLDGLATWSPLASAGAWPATAYGIAAAMDSAGDRVLLAGGTNGRLGEYTRTDHWLLSFGDVMEPVDLVLSSVETTPRQVTLVWSWSPTVSGIAARVERSSTGVTWQDIGAVTLLGNDQLVFTDTDVAPGARYGYRLRTTADGVERVRATTWVSVPGSAAFALENPRPNPAATGAAISFELPRPGRAELTVYDLGGRRRESHVLNAGRPGWQTLRVGAGLEPGIYFVRLAQGTEAGMRKLCIVR